MKHMILAALLLSLTGAVAQAQSWQNSPMNFNNSPMNFDNSPMNFRNSPMNYNNSQMNPNSNGIYDTTGQYQGYAVPRPSGGTNFFSPDGTRTGYRGGN